MKWKLVPVEPDDAMIWKAEEDSPEFHHGDPWYGSEPPSEGQINAIYKAMLEAAPQPPALTDERILEICGFRPESAVEVGADIIRKRWLEIAREIEREILGGGHE